MIRSKPHIQSHPLTCHCATCDEPDPHCDHGVNLYDADCPTCDAIAAERQAEAKDATLHQLLSGFAREWSARLTDASCPDDAEMMLRGLKALLGRAR